MTKKWRFIVRVDGDKVYPFNGDFFPLSEKAWEMEQQAGITESGQGGWWIPVEVDEDDL